MGKSKATIEDLRLQCKLWLDSKLKGPKSHPGLELWNGIDLAKTFANEINGQTVIAGCLRKHQSRFSKTGVNEQGVEIWKCLNLEFLKR